MMAAMELSRAPKNMMPSSCGMAGHGNVKAAAKCHDAACIAPRGAVDGRACSCIVQQMCA